MYIFFLFLSKKHYESHREKYEEQYFYPRFSYRVVIIYGQISVIVRKLSDNVAISAPTFFFISRVASNLYIISYFCMYICNLSAVITSFQLGKQQRICCVLLLNKRCFII